MTARDVAKRIYLECGEGNRAEFDVDGAERIINEFVAAKVAEIAGLKAKLDWITLVAKAFTIGGAKQWAGSWEVWVKCGKDTNGNQLVKPLTFNRVAVQDGLPVENQNLRTALEAAMGESQ